MVVWFRDLGPYTLLKKPIAANTKQSTHLQGGPIAIAKANAITLPMHFVSRRPWTHIDLEMPVFADVTILTEDEKDDDMEYADENGWGSYH